MQNSLGQTVFFHKRNTAGEGASLYGPVKNGKNPLKLQIFFKFNISLT
jgi:hypothetical protein